MEENNTLANELEAVLENPDSIYKEISETAVLVKTSDEEKTIWVDARELKKILELEDPDHLVPLHIIVEGQVINRL